MKLSDILRDVEIIETRGNLNADIAHICIDSRKVGPDDLFVAMPGTITDGHTFIPKALEQGAVAIVQTQPLPEATPEGTTFIRVADAEVAVGPIASA